MLSPELVFYSTRKVKKIQFDVSGIRWFEGLVLCIDVPYVDFSHFVLCMSI